MAQSGDVVKITAGDYHGDVATWSVSNLTICGIGGRARLFADGRNAQGKGLWVVSGSNVTIDSGGHEVTADEAARPGDDNEFFSHSVRR